MAIAQAPYIVTNLGVPSNIATVNVTINLMNDPPIAVADVRTLPLGDTSTINIMMLANDTDEETPGTVSFTGLGTCDHGLCGAVRYGRPRDR